ncbi:putative carboxylesterase [Fimicolochytrium jonesii]|uniref:putative carboxylesterase n=1 Tax=Fimicolochytrium jonesii TaxID=1396493 RepID=UPI0022FEBCC1|nr:putative carboxylesterase [Fimicolochytrium jonesii]KAI8823481.1 putative carboxylesterase [Fimicolochytrium jonesii]
MQLKTSPFIVETQYGKVEGVPVDSTGDVAVWRGVPFAKPPIGDLRFRPPQGPNGWEGVRSAKNFGTVSPQGYWGLNKYVSQGAEQDEDCLYLNVWAPSSLPADAKKPVMVWIHGGAYMTGSGSTPAYNGEHLVRTGDVVIVTINYRLSSFGFLYVDIPDIETNLGMQDQVAALRWVKNNIEAFGGDPSCVTIFGESAGGNAVTTLMAMPSAKGLFHRAIAQSPLPTSVHSRSEALMVGNNVLRELGLSKPDASALRAVPADELVSAARAVFHKMVLERPGVMPFSPIVDGNIIPQDPLAAIRNGYAKDIPLMLGVNKDEANLFHTMDPKHPAVPLTELQIERYFSSNTQAGAQIQAAYPGFPALPARLRLASDIAFCIPTQRFAEGHTKSGPTYMYRFDYAPVVLRWTGMGATHATEIPFVFGTYNSNLMSYAAIALSFGGQYRRLSDRMRCEWTTFARRGVPADESWTEYKQERLSKIWNGVDSFEKDWMKEKAEVWSEFRPYTDF